MIPERIAPGLAPGGLVVHVYHEATGDLLLSRALPGGWADAPGIVETAAVSDSMRAEMETGGVDVRLVWFDGDTGEPFDGG